MKKQLILAVLFLVVGTSLVFAGSFGAGVSAGGSLSFVGTEPSGEGSPRYGFTGGIYGDYAFYAVEDVVDFSVQPGVYYTQKGFRTVLEDYGNAEMDVNMDYVEMSVLLKSSFNLNLPVAPYILIGPSVGMVVVESTKVEPSAVSAVGDGYLANQKDFDYGVVFGAGVDLDMGVSIDARFNLGLMNIDETATGDNFTKNRSVTVMASYNIL